MNPPEPGWYRDPYFKNRERYWDGEVWSDECRLVQPALSSGTSDATTGRHQRVVQPDPVTAQQPAVPKDPITTQQPATQQPSDTQPIRIFSGGVAGAGAASILGGNVPAPGGGPVAGGAAGGDATAAPPTKAEVTANAERVRTVGAAALLGGDIGSTTDGTPPPTRSIKTPKEPPAEATRRVSQEADPLLGISMPGTNSAAAATVLSEQEASKSHRRGLIIAVAAVVIVLAGLGAYLALGPNSTKGGGGTGGAKSATATAATATLHQKTAHVAIQVKLTSALGQTDGPSAVGDFDLSKSQGTMTLTAPGLPAPGTTQMIFEKKTVYVEIGPGLSAVLPGKTWISADVLQVSSSTSAVGASLSGLERTVGNPAGVLHQLKVSGATVVSLGHSTFDGTPVQGYTVTLSSKALSRSADLVPASHTTETVYVASASGLVTAIVIPSTVTTDGQVINQNTYIVFSNFGAPVTVTPPPSSDVATIEEYQAAVANKPTTPTTAPAVSPVPSTMAPTPTAIPGALPTTTTTPAASGSPSGASSPGLG